MFLQNRMLRLQNRQATTNRRLVGLRGGKNRWVFVVTRKACGKKCRRVITILTSGIMYTMVIKTCRK